MLWLTSENKMIKGLILTIQFLTRLPINIPVDFNDENIKKSTFFFPYVGILLGAIASLPYILLGKQNMEIASVLTVISMIFLTGGLHLDGLSDTVDGFFSNKKKEDILAIMKDSRIGAFGVLSLIILVLFKYVLISNFNIGLPIALMLSMGNARLIVLLQIAFKNIARPGGLGDMLHRSKANKYIIGTSILYIILIIYIDIKFLFPLFISFVIGELISLYTYKKIDGFTGDVYGACIEIIESTSLLVFWGVLNWI